MNILQQQIINNNEVNKMKKSICILSFFILLFTGCGKEEAEMADAFEEKMQTYQIMIPASNGAAMADMDLRFNFSQFSEQELNRLMGETFGDWTGIIKVSGDNIDGTSAVYLYRDLIPGGAVRLRLPIGSKTVSMKLIRHRIDSLVDIYAGSGILTVEEHNSSLSIDLYQEGNGEIGTVDSSCQTAIAVTVQGTESQEVIAGTRVQFSLNDKVVATVSIDEKSQPVFLLTQGQELTDIDQGYVYEVSAPGSETKTGVLKVSANGIADNDEASVDNTFRKDLADSDTGDDVPPVIENISVTDVIAESKGPLVLTVAAKDNRNVASVQVLANAIPYVVTVPVNGTYSFEIPVGDLSLGLNAISITAYDGPGATGNFSTQVVSVITIDDILPVIEVALPSTANSAIGTNQNMFTFNFTVEESRGIDTVTAVIGTQFYEVTLNPDGSTYSASCSILTNTLADGPNDLIITAADSSSNQSSSTYSVILYDDSAPWFIVDSLSGSVIDYNGFHTRPFKLGDNRGIATVTVNGTTVYPDANGFYGATAVFTWWWQDVYLKVIATDTAGNQTSAIVKINTATGAINGFPVRAAGWQWWL
ncbi:MAG: hypothetical protein GY754_47220 [bacterium]|nr:hypothetical protein [bacterium]